MTPSSGQSLRTSPPPWRQHRRCLGRRWRLSFRGMGFQCLASSFDRRQDDGRHQPVNTSWTPAKHTVCPPIRVHPSTGLARPLVRASWRAMMRTWAYWLEPPRRLTDRPRTAGLGPSSDGGRPERPTHTCLVELCVPRQARPRREDRGGQSAEARIDWRRPRRPRPGGEARST
jgi:hypothetical protein